MNEGLELQKDFKDADTNVRDFEAEVHQKKVNILNRLVSTEKALGTNAVTLLELLATTDSANHLLVYTALRQLQAADYIHVQQTAVPYYLLSDKFLTK